ncbi:MAG: NAD-dependent deacylase [Chitinophagaceae bacterium]|nr:NAD-dependent deacylase [Anaerolineae bacterium]
MIFETLNDKIVYAASLFKQSHYALAFTGAGISTDSGIPDFRSQESGLWQNVDPMTVASIFGFKRNPQAFYDWVAPLTRTTMNARPNSAHIALANLERRGFLHGVITQNIDMLHTRAGSQCIYELHGHMRTATCISCFQVFEGEPILIQFLEDGLVPHCKVCKGVLKPDVILFGEQLPIREFQNAQEAARRCDLMLVVGSSLEVAPAGDIPIMAARRGAKLIVINLEPTPADKMAEIVIHARAADILPEIARRVETL